MISEKKGGNLVCPLIPVPFSKNSDERINKIQSSLEEKEGKKYIQCVMPLRQRRSVANGK